MDDAIPPAWRPYLEAIGVDSANALADRAGIHTTTLMRMMRGESKSKPENIKSVRLALKLDADEMSALLGRRVAPPIQMPAEFGLLTRRQQEAIVSVVRSIIDSAEDSGGEVVELSRGPKPAPEPVKHAARTRKDTAERRRRGGGTRGPKGSA